MRCPKCGSDEGYYENIIDRHSQCYDFSGNPIYAGEFYYIRGGKIKKCISCEKNITKYIEENNKC